MKTFLAACLAALLLISAASAAPLDAEQARLVLQLQQGDHAAEADAVQAKAQLAAEHTQNLAAVKDGTEAKQQAAELGDKLAALQVKYDAAVKTIWWYRLRFWGPLVFAVLALVIFLLTRFTAWGAKTFGPYILGAETIAAKAAVLA